MRKKRTIVCQISLDLLSLETGIGRDIVGSGHSKNHYLPIIFHNTEYFKMLFLFKSILKTSKSHTQRFKVVFMKFVIIECLHAVWKDFVGM